MISSCDNGRIALPRMTQSSPRQNRRKSETRAKLIAAAKTLIARNGAESMRIREITDEADVGFGSFYNHFANKDEIVEVVLAEMVLSHANTVASAISELEDPAEVISAANRLFVRRARSDPEWAWLLLRLDLSHDLVTNALGPYALADLRAAIEAGRMSVPDVGIALRAQGGALIAVMRAVVDGDAPPEADIFHAEGVLRMLGLSADDAASVARRPLPGE